MSNDLEDALASELFKEFGAGKVRTRERDERRTREKRYAANPKDGRRARSTGRTKAFASKMKPDLHARLLAQSKALKKSFAELLEQAAEELLAKLEKTK
jgi:hypothetical protein